MGWTDVGYRNDSGVNTPILDSLAADGILLDRYYVQPVCSPSRAALMQGRYPFKTGMQHYNTIMPTSFAAMPMEQPTMAELFLSAGYKTVAIGKWHLGYAYWKNTPTGRGFESHEGYFQGEVDYYTKKFMVPHEFLPIIDVIGLDWWRNRTAVWTQEGIYNKILYDKFMNDALDAYAPSSQSPLFLYYAHQDVHVPLDRPSEEWFKNCSHIKDTKRNIYCAMLAAVDNSLELLVNKLKAKGMWDDTILIVTTDNGGMPDAPGAFPASAGVNYPLRAGKGTVFEGGVRAIGFVQGGKNVIPASARGTTIQNELIHMVDWLPTLVNMSGNVNAPNNIDGEDLWDVLVNGAKVARSSIPLNLNYNVSYPDGGYQASVMTKEWKLIYEKVSGVVLNYDGWFPPPPGKPIPATPNPSGTWLFNLKDDPNEHHNVYDQNPAVVAQLHAIMTGYMKDYMHPQPNDFHVEGLPWWFDGSWAPFADW
eukprot:TRINITY_DN11665_c0_g1_i1.p1 TRINITY_DN11665_c0_g1~~TRINITY_DN11665_c0_g1_i1.p1  ORF type:complete len:534 (-),score=84.01 TRINITY_DN11665_c0_g1_i1:340-1773(-)